MKDLLLDIWSAIKITREAVVYLVLIMAWLVGAFFTMLRDETYAWFNRIHLGKKK